MEDLANDALRLVSKIISDTFESYILVHIAQSEFLVFSYKSAPEVPTIYGYVIDRTPAYLENERVCKLLFSDFLLVPSTKYEYSMGQAKKLTDIVMKKAIEPGYMKFTGKNFPPYLGLLHKPEMKGLASIRGLHLAVFSRDRCIAWIKEVQETASKPSLRPQERDYWYEDNRLNIRMIDGSVLQVNFSRAHISRTIFEVFWFLWKSNPAGAYDLSEIIDEYKKRFKDNLPTDSLGDRVSNIRATIFPPEIMSSKRVEWNYNRIKKKWIFRLNPIPLP